MSVLAWQIVIAVGTLLLVSVQFSLQCQHCRRQRGQERRVVPVRLAQRPAVPYVSRVSERHERLRVVSTRTIALATLPMPINGTIDVPEGAPSQLLPADLRFAPPDAALLRRVLEGLRALPDNPRDTPASRR